MATLATLFLLELVTWTTTSQMRSNFSQLSAELAVFERLDEITIYTYTGENVVANGSWWDFIFSGSFSFSQG